jgi:putative transcriptional regulator
MQEYTYLNNHFLIAMPALADPNFFQTVTYICSHNADGALGIVINRPTQLTLGELLKQLEVEPIPPELTSKIVFSGGPVQKGLGFVIHTPIGSWDSTLKVTDNIGITTSRDILEALVQGRGPGKAFMALGYAGWGAGQLEQEIVDNAWLSGPADPEILFHTPVEQRWSAAAAAIGVDLSLLSGDAGHA